MGKSKYDDLGDSIIELIGGKENIISLKHCLTRLRFSLKDRALIDEGKINETKGVISSQWQGEQYQIIIGQHVGDVYQVICEKTGMEAIGVINADEGPTKQKFSAVAVFDAISGCIIPIFPILIGGGLIRAILMLLLQIGIVDAENSTYIVLSFVSDAAFYFLPVFVGAAGARKFGANMAIGMLIGATLIHPQFIEMITNGVSLSVYSIPIYATNYANSIFPMILATFVLSYVEKFISKFTPQAVKSLLVPTLSLLIMVPLVLVLLAPIGAFAGGYLTAGIMWLYKSTGFFAVAVLSTIFVFLTMTGMHASLFPAILSMFAAFGYEPLIVLAGVLYTISQGVVALIVAFKTKNSEEKATALTCTLTAFVAGISEPALYGYSLRYRKLLYCSMIGCFLGGAYAGLMHVYAYAVAGSVGFLALPVFIGPDAMNLVHTIISIALTCVSTFILGIKFGYKTKEEI